MTRKGFTIVELLIVISIVTLLIGTASISLKSIKVSNRDAGRITDVLLISKAIDQYAFANAGVYPKSSSGSVGCANTITSLDLSLFPKKAIPTDPLPAGISCYTYHTHYVPHSGAAFAQNVTYSLEFGLEKPRGVDASIKKPSDLGLTTYSDTASGRYRYFINGKYCGNNCY